MIKIGLIGCGAVVHASYSKVLRGRDAYDVRWVCDLDNSQAQSAAALFDAKISTSAEIAELADAIVISTPPSSHAALVEQSLRSGRTILCEKPFMTSTDEAVRTAALAREAGTALYVGHFRRTYPQVELAKQLVTNGAIGDVTAVRASEGGRFTWRSVSDYPIRDPHGGVLWDTGSHTLDMALFASGLDASEQFKVTEVAVERDKHEPSHDFNSRFVVETDAGRVNGRLHVSRRDALPNFIRIAGERGSIRFSVDLDDRIRLDSPSGSTVFKATQAYSDFIECFDVQARRVLLATEGSENFLAHRFLNQVRLLEALSRG